MENKKILSKIDLHEFVDSLIKALESKDLYTSGHSERVAHLSKRIGEELEMEKNRLFNLHIAGHLHDIGKIGVRDSILNKKDRLTEVEYKEIQRHSQLGFEILKGVKVFEDISQFVKYHHERYDGKGYPQGLKGDEIPLESRIISVADAFDAMTSPRPYRNQINIKDALKEIILNKDSQFDPKIVTIISDVYENDIDFLKNLNEEPKLIYLQKNRKAL